MNPDQINADLLRCDNHPADRGQCLTNDITAGNIEPINADSRRSSKKCFDIEDTNCVI